MFDLILECCSIDTNTWGDPMLLLKSVLVTVIWSTLNLISMEFADVLATNMCMSITNHQIKIIMWTVLKIIFCQCNHINDMHVLQYVCVVETMVENTQQAGQAENCTFIGSVGIWPSQTLCVMVLSSSLKCTALLTHSPTELGPGKVTAVLSGTQLQCYCNHMGSKRLFWCKDPV